MDSQKWCPLDGVRCCLVLFSEQNASGHRLVGTGPNGSIVHRVVPIRTPKGRDGERPGVERPGRGKARTGEGQDGERPGWGKAGMGKGQTGERPGRGKAGMGKGRDGKRPGRGKAETGKGREMIMVTSQAPKLPQNITVPHQKKTQK